MSLCWEAEWEEGNIGKEIVRKTGKQLDLQSAECQRGTAHPQ